MPTLSFTHGDLNGQRIPLAQSRITVGRSKSNTLQIPDDSVSLNHCVFLVHDSEVLVCECDSSNGTYVDDLRVAKQQPVKSGQTIRFGRVTARLEIEPDEDPTSADEITAVRGFQRALKRAHQSPAPSSPPTPLSESNHTVDQDAPTVVLRSAPAPRPQPALSSAGRGSAPALLERIPAWAWMSFGVFTLVLALWALSRLVR